MTHVLVQTYDTSKAFAPCPCPKCGAIENLDLAVDGFWDCNECGHQFTITLARIITDNDLPWSRVMFDDGGYIQDEPLSLTST